MKNKKIWFISSSELSISFRKYDKFDIYVEGSLSYRMNSSSNQTFSNNYDLVYSAIEKYGEDFIEMIKGNFIIIIRNEDNIKVFGDRFGVLKYFYYSDSDYFIISNSIKEIIKRVTTKLSKHNMAIYALTYHFTGGKTAFENIYHNQLGECLTYNFNSRKKEISYYWNASELLNQESSNIRISDISKSLVEVVKSVVNKNEKYSLSLTGGSDTRNLLAILLKLKQKTHLYTYGNPLSNDCVIASKIAKSLKIDHNIYDVSMTDLLFEQKARDIINFSGGMASIHRAHRIIAIEKESKYAKKMFLGTLGGEFIRGVSEDNYIVPPIVYNNWAKEVTKQDVKKLLSDKCIQTNDLEIDDIIRDLNTEKYLSGDIIERKFYSLVDITAHLHDAQDINLYREFMDEVYTPFLDIDYLELIFKSCYTFNNKEEFKNKYLKRIQNPLFASRFIKETYKPLLSFCYAGLHKPSEVVFNKYSAAILKMIRKLFVKKKPSNFPLSIWMEKFVEKELPLCSEYEDIDEVFDINQLIKDFKTEKHIYKESYWLKYTNPIMMRYIVEELL